MSNLLVSVAQKMAARVGKSQAGDSPGRHFTFVFIAAIGIAAGAGLVMNGNRQSPILPEMHTVKTQRVVSSVHVKVRAYPVAVKQQADPQELIRTHEDLSETITAASRRGGAANSAQLAQQVRLTDTITTASAMVRDASETQLPVLPPNSARFGGKLPASNAATAPAAVDAVVGNTASSPPHPSSIETIDVANTEVAAVEIERKLTALGADHFEPPTGPTEPARSAEADQGLMKTRANSYVSLRAGPDKRTSELAVVPARAAILAQDNCQHWCRVIYNGRKGYIYKSYIDDPNRNLPGTEPARSKPKAGKTTSRSISRKTLAKSWTSKRVNLRSGPNNNATVLASVPENTELLAQKNCAGWCSVIYKGRKGYIYSAFLVDAKLLASNRHALAR